MRAMGGLPGKRAAACSLFVAAAVLGGVLGTAAVASAHDPIIVTDGQTTPESGPLLVDGTVSFAVYGRVGGGTDTRGLRVQLAAGDRLNLGLLVPAVEPEASFGPDQFPVVDVVRPDGGTVTLAAGSPTKFDEPFSSTSYLELVTLQEPAQAGIYSLTVHAPVPSRFVVSVGTEERFGSAVENVDNRDAGVAAVQEWYQLPPSAAVTPTEQAGTAVETIVPDTVTLGSPMPVGAAPGTDVTGSAPESTMVALGTSETLTLGAPSTTLEPEKASGTAGTLVFVGVMAAIVIGGAVLYARRRTRGIGTPPT